MAEGSSSAEGSPMATNGLQSLVSHSVDCNEKSCAVERTVNIGSDGAVLLAEESGDRPPEGEVAKCPGLVRHQSSGLPWSGCLCLYYSQFPLAFVTILRRTFLINHLWFISAGN